MSSFPSPFRWFFGALLAATVAIATDAAETIPPAPAHYFNDYAGVVSASAGAELNSQLEGYERESSNQLLVAVFPKMESDSSVEDYTVRVAQAWRVGQKKNNNGAVLFAFMAEHKLYIQVGYGLEPVLTDARCREIIENDLKPAFRSGRYDDGMRAAVSDMIAVTKGEYKGTGKTVADQLPHFNSRTLWALVIFGYIVITLIRSRRQNTFIGGRRTGLMGGAFWLGGGGSSGRSNWSGGGGGGGFSGGGGSFGGGGAGGSW